MMATTFGRRHRRCGWLPSWAAKPLATVLLRDTDGPATARSRAAITVAATATTGAAAAATTARPQVREMEATYDQKIGAEVERFRALQREKEQLAQQWEDRSRVLEEEHEQYMADLEERYRQQLEQERQMREKIARDRGARAAPPPAAVRWSRLLMLLWCAAHRVGSPPSRAARRSPLATRDSPLTHCPNSSSCSSSLATLAPVTCPRSPCRRRMARRVCAPRRRCGAAV